MDGAKNLDASVIAEAEKNMADIIIKLLSEPELLKKYQKASIGRAGKFTGESYTEQILKWLKEKPL
jgi:glycosyltransferase involved in cell wall biosynthesis